jgi:uncharacterized damage-inducible protein DinB
MKSSESLAKELTNEARTTRRHLERLPDDKLGWKPHPKSYSAGELACHLVDCIRWTEPLFTSDAFDLDPATYRICKAESVAELLATFDADVARCAAVLAGVADEDLVKTWRLSVKGKQMFERPKTAVFRDFVIKHLIHHRGQLTVYLRLLDVPLAGTYGPTADEPF